MARAEWYGPTFGPHSAGLRLVGVGPRVRTPHGVGYGGERGLHAPPWTGQPQGSVPGPYPFRFPSPRVTRGCDSPHGRAGRRGRGAASDNSGGQQARPARARAFRPKFLLVGQHRPGSRPGEVFAPPAHPRFSRGRGGAAGRGGGGAAFALGTTPVRTRPRSVPGGICTHRPVSGLLRGGGQAGGGSRAQTNWRSRTSASGSCSPSS